MTAPRPEVEQNVSQLSAGRELDALVAERVMGWYLKGRRWIDPERREFAGFTTEPQYDPNSDRDHPLWEPSSDMASAWEVVEKMRPDWRFLFQETPGRRWRAVFSSHSERDLAKMEDADSAPEAICKAALQAVGLRGPGEGE